MNASTATSPPSLDPRACNAVVPRPSEIVAAPVNSLVDCQGSRGRFCAFGGVSDSLIDADEPDEGDPFQETPESYVIVPKGQKTPNSLG